MTVLKDPANLLIVLDCWYFVEMPQILWNINVYVLMPFLNILNVFIIVACFIAQNRLLLIWGLQSVGHSSKSASKERFYHAT